MLEKGRIMDDMMTRRGFLAAGASCAALAALGASTGCSSSQPESSDSDDLATYTTATLCAGCANACGIEAWVRDEELWRFGRSKDPAQIVEDACGEPFDARHYCDYLVEKFSAIYGL